MAISYHLVSLCTKSWEKSQNQKRNARYVFQFSLYNILTVHFIQGSDIGLQSTTQRLQNEPVYMIFRAVVHELPIGERIMSCRALLFWVTVCIPSLQVGQSNTALSSLMDRLMPMINEYQPIVRNACKTAEDTEPHSLLQHGWPTSRDRIDRIRPVLSSIAVVRQYIAATGSS